MEKPAQSNHPANQYAAAAAESQTAEQAQHPASASAGHDPAAAALAPRVEQLEQALAAAQAQAAEHQDLYVRARADVENARRRAQEEVAKAHKFGIEAFAESMLPVKDSLEAALTVQQATLDNYRQGIEMTLRQLSSAFEKNRLIEINPVGEKFDPHRHQAIAMVPADQEANTVVATMQKGYMIADRVLRPAMVSVAQPKPAQAAKS